MSELQGDLLRIERYVDRLYTVGTGAMTVIARLVMEGMLYAEGPDGLVVCKGCWQQAFVEEGQSYPHQTSDLGCPVRAAEEWAVASLRLVAQGPDGA